MSKLKLTMKPAQATALVKPAEAKSNLPTTTATWARMLDRKGYMGPPGTRRYTSPPKKDSTSPMDPPVLDEDIAFHSSTAAPLPNPYAAPDGAPLHPFFMSPEARKAHQMKENQQKLQSQMEKRQAEIKANNSARGKDISAFFAPRPKATPNATVSTTESRSKWNNYGNALPEFPVPAHVTPPLDSPLLHEATSSLQFSLKNMMLDANEAILDPVEIGKDFSYTLKRYAELSLDSSDPTMSISANGHSASMEGCASEEKSVSDVSLQIAQSHLELRASLGMRVSDQLEVKEQEKVALLDVRAEDMAEHIAQQQQAAAERQVAEELFLLTSKFQDPPYTVETIADLCRSHLEKQQKNETSLPWTARFAPSKANHVCGNQKCAMQMKDWLLGWKAATEAMAAEVPKAADFFKKRSPLTKPVAPPPSTPTTTQEALVNCWALVGAPGCGKTSTVYALAEELGFEVLEVNASSKRSGATLRSTIEEATQSKHVGRASGTMTIVLFEEVDQTFAEDAGFLSALVSLCEMTKRPIVMTCEAVPGLLQAKLPKMQTYHLNQPDTPAIFVHCASICFANGLSLPPPPLIDKLCRWFDHDLRAILNNLQIWAPYLHQYGWELAIFAFAGVCSSSFPPSPSSPSSLMCGAIPTNVPPHVLFDLSESTDMPQTLDLIHRHPLLLSDASEGSQLDNLRSLSQHLDTLALADTWRHCKQDEDKLTTSHAVQQDLRVALLCLTSELMRPATAKAPKSVENHMCYSVYNLPHERATKKMIDQVTRAMIFDWGRPNNFDNITMLHLMACLEDQQRLQNTKRRAYKTKLDWAGVDPVSRLQFVQALMLHTASAERP